MKSKNLFWIVTAVLAIATIAAGVAVFINRFIKDDDDENYIECDLDVADE